MQTFLPHPNFVRSLACLDRQRLGKQRVEVLQILRTLNSVTTGWCNHPAVRMWRGYERALAVYGLLACVEWRLRGYNDTCMEKIAEFSDKNARIVYPPWFGDDAFHASHRSNLLRKNPEWYGVFGWLEPDDLPYVWPV